MDYTQIFQRCEGYCGLILLSWPEGRSRVVRFADVDIPLWHWVLSKLILYYYCCHFFVYKLFGNEVMWNLI